MYVSEAHPVHISYILRKTQYTFQLLEPDETIVFSYFEKLRKTRLNDRYLLEKKDDKLRWNSLLFRIPFAKDFKFQRRHVAVGREKLIVERINESAANTETRSSGDKSRREIVLYYPAMMYTQIKAARQCGD